MIEFGHLLGDGQSSSHLHTYYHPNLLSKNKTLRLKKYTNVKVEKYNEESFHCT